MTEQNGQTRSIKVGSRKSQLALIQTRSVISRLQSLFPQCEYELVAMTTTGDNILDKALSKIGEKSLFTKELENALSDRSVDFVVHSLKDLPTELPPDMVIGAVCKRDDPRDALVCHARFRGQEVNLRSLPDGSQIGTSSLRRAAQLKRNFPGLVIKDVRGNLNTRLCKLDRARDYDALVLAVAGMQRMGWHDRISYVLDPDTECMYAVSQGAIAVECRASDPDILLMLSSLHDYETVIRTIAERSFLRELEGGCSVPVAVYTEFIDNQLTMKAGVYSLDGCQAVLDSLSGAVPQRPIETSGPPAGPPAGPVEQFSCTVAQNFSPLALRAAEQLGRQLALNMVQKGAEKILREAKQETAQEIMRAHAEKVAEKVAAS